MGSRVLITGGAGFIGSHLADKLVGQGLASVLILDNMFRGHMDNLQYCRDRITLRVGDIRNPGVVAECAQGCDVIFHLAAQSNVIGSTQDAGYCFATNVEGTFNVLEAARTTGVGRVVFTSSREVYGDSQTLPVPESAPLVPKNAYGASKAAGEVYCQAWRNTGIETAILRLANVYGPRDRDRVVPIFIENALAGRPLVLYGGSQIIDFVWIEDVVEALVQAGFGEYVQIPVNVGSGRGMAMAELARRVLEATGSLSQIHQAAARDVEVTRFEADVSLARRLFHLKKPSDPLWRMGDVVKSIRSKQAKSDWTEAARVTSPVSRC